MIDKILDIIRMIISMIKSIKDKKDAEDIKTETEATRNNCLNDTSSEWLRQFGGTDHRNNTKQKTNTTSTSNEHNNN
jgi:hypothetical protein